MSMQPGPWPEPAEEITRAVRAIYGGRRQVPLPVQVRDQLGEVFGDGEFAEAFGVRGRPGWSPGRLALVTVLQMAENLTDRQAADAVRLRIDWKYALGLGLAEAGVDASVLCEFRARVLAHGLEEKALDVLLAALKDKGLVAAGGKQRTDSTHVISAVRDLNRLELAGEAVRACLEALAAAAPTWTAEVIDVAGWAKRYGPRVDTWRLPTAKAKRAELAVAYGRDAFTLLTAVYHPDAPTWLREVPAVEVLRTVVLQNYTRSVDRRGREVVKRREADTDGLPPGRLRLTSPYDTDARWGVKRDTFWNGYKVHVSETCHPPTCVPAPGSDASADADVGPVPLPRVSGRPAVQPGKQRAKRPNLITNVATTDATVPDAAMLDTLHQSLAARELLPAEHYLDAGYPSAELIVGARAAYGITLITPVGLDTSAQARANAGYDASAFHLDWANRQATCPQGHTSAYWNPCSQRGTDAIVVRFARSTCTPCPARDQCTTSTRQGRQLTIRPRQLHDTLRQARSEQDAKPWQANYALRAGVEGTIRQGIAVCGMRRARYRGLAKTHLEHVFSAVALNLIRLDAWWNGHPLDRTRTSHLARLDLSLAA